MFRRWHTGHSLGAGILGGLVIAQDPLLIYLAGLASGAATVIFTIGGWRLGKTLLGAFEAWRKDARAKTENLRKTERISMDEIAERYQQDEVPF